jgi:hypothetical protein
VPSRNGGPVESVRESLASAGKSATGSVGSAGKVVGESLGSAGKSVGSAASKAKGPMLTGGAPAAGVVGGLVIGSRILRPRKRVLGVPISRRGLSLRPLAHEVRAAGRQLARMADEVGWARRQVQRVGHALSTDEQRRQSPVEVLLSALTNRRQPGRH